MSELYAKVILEDDLTDEPHVIDGETTRYENLYSIRRVSIGELSHLEDVTFERSNGETFTERCYFQTSGEMGE